MCVRVVRVDCESFRSHNTFRMLHRRQRAVAGGSGWWWQRQRALYDVNVRMIKREKASCSVLVMAIDNELYSLHGRMQYTSQSLF